MKKTMVKVEYIKGNTVKTKEISMDKAVELGTSASILIGLGICDKVVIYNPFEGGILKVIE